jgi:hypothetical protein
LFESTIFLFFFFPEDISGVFYRKERKKLNDRESIGFSVWGLVQTMAFFSCNEFYLPQWKCSTDMEENFDFL